MGKVLVTGSAGFIGFHLTQRLLKEGRKVIGLDCLSPYYSVKLKGDRNAQLLLNPAYSFQKKDLGDKNFLLELFQSEEMDAVYHLGAQAGVRYSIDNPDSYVSTNIQGTLNVLEAIRKVTYAKPRIYFASSSSVYGLTDQSVFREDDAADRPVSFYGATKRSGELMAHSYSHLYGVPVTALRFFTVYGPWGRPDMAPFKFVDRVLHGEPIEVYNNGDMVRDFTYVDDVVEGIVRLSKRPAGQAAPYEIFNIGSANPRPLMEFISVIEKATGTKANLHMMPFQQGDVHQTAADVTRLKKAVGYSPCVRLEEGMPRFVSWYKDYYGSARP